MDWGRPILSLSQQHVFVFFLSQEGIRHWHRVPRDVAAPSLQVFKAPYMGL